VLKPKPAAAFLIERGRQLRRPRHRNNAVWKNLANWRLSNAPLLFDVKDGHRLFDPTGFVCEDDSDAIIRATVLAIGVSLDSPKTILSAAAL
jgi:hypothetical protein